MPSFLFSSRQVFTPQVPRPELGAIFRGHLCTRSKDSRSFLLSSPHGGCSQAWDLLACLEKCQVGGCTASPEHSAVPLPGSSSGDGGPQAHHTALTDRPLAGASGVPVSDLDPDRQARVSSLVAALLGTKSCCSQCDKNRTMKH